MFTLQRGNRVPHTINLFDNENITEVNGIIRRGGNIWVNYRNYYQNYIIADLKKTLLDVKDAIVV